MNSRSPEQQRTIGIVWFVIGVALMATSNSTGFVFLILGVAFMASSTQRGQALAQQNPWLKGLMLALAAITVVLLAIAILSRIF